jgi:hypothetical protein
MFKKLLIPSLAVAQATRLTTSGDKFVYNGKYVFLNGMNQAWINYGNDFGDSQPASKFCALKKYL